jgi:dTMP kinase
MTFVAGEPDRADPGPMLAAIEGIDGSGKTTLAAALAGSLARCGIRVTGHREPGDGPADGLLRSLSRDGNRHPMMLALLSAADRYDQQARLAAQDCAVVISDRYYLSGLAYHAADGIDQLLYQRLNAGVRRPDLYLFLQVDPAVAAARLGDRARDRWERGGIAARVPQCYQAALHLVETTENAQVARLDATAAPRHVLVQALAALAPLLPEPQGVPCG